MGNEGLQYYIGNHIMIQSLKEDGYTRALDLIKTYLRANGIALFKANKEGIYEIFAEEKIVENNMEFVESIINSASNLIEKRDFINIDIHDNDCDNLLFIRIKTSNNKYILAAKNNLNKDEKDLFTFTEIIGEALSVVLEKQELYEKVKRNSLEDGLTELDNRAAYNKKAVEMNEANKNYTFILLDLFRLKYVNDNISHAAGDKYIVDTANILKKFFPKFRNIKTVEGTSKKVETGDVVYRIGGDEFAIITNSTNLFEVETKIQLACEEVKDINLGIDEKLPLGLNYGIVTRKNNEKFEELYVEADKKLSDNKRAMYTSLGLDRRK